MLCCTAVNIETPFPVLLIVDKLEPKDESTCEGPGVGLDVGCGGGPEQTDHCRNVWSKVRFVTYKHLTQMYM